MIRQPFLLLILATCLLMIPACKHGNKSGNILVIFNRDSYGLYTPEILRAEGITCFDTVSISRSAKCILRPEEYSAIILSSDVADTGLKKKLMEYVADGGKLISVVPLKEGWENLYSKPRPVASDTKTYIFIDTLQTTGTGLTGHRIRVHSERVRSEAGNHGIIALFGDGSSTNGNDPAVITVKKGRGTVIAFMYNLPADIVLTRQGNPETAGLEKDDIPGLRAMDLFTGGWVDTDCNTINQADEQMHLLARLIEMTAFSDSPLPRTWYFPDTLRCLVTLTNDGEYRHENDFEIQFRDIDSSGASMSLYVMETDKVSRDWAQRWTKKGFEIAGHPDNTREAASPVWSHVDSVLAAKMNDISTLYGLQMKTVVNHWFVWCGTDASGKQDFSAQAQIEANHGILLDANYAHYDNNSTSGHFLGSQGRDQGNYTGSGLPMKFAATDGSVINIWQHLNNIYDQQYNENHDPSGFFEAFRGLMDRSMDNDVWSYISIKSHNDEYYFSKEPLLRMISYAHSRGIPVWTAERLADFLEKRDRARISGLSFDSSVLSFTFGPVGTGGDHLSLLIPFMSGNSQISNIKINDGSGSFVKRNLRGMDYAILTINDPGISRVKVSYN